MDVAVLQLVTRVRKIGCQSQDGVYNYLMRYKPKTVDPTGKPVVKRGTITVL